MIEASVTIDTTTPVLNRLARGLRDKGRLHATLAIRAEALTRDHVRREAPRRHSTADRLGGRRTGHLSKAAEAIESRSDSSGAVVSFPRNTGLQRAFRDVRIVPRRSKFIAIPISGASYGRRPREFDNTFIIGSRRGNLLIVREDGEDQLDLLFVLVKEVTQRQDRTLLPSDDDYSAAMEQGARDYVADNLRGGSRA